MQFRKWGFLLLLYYFILIYYRLLCSQNLSFQSDFLTQKSPIEEAIMGTKNEAARHRIIYYPKFIVN